MCTAQSTLLSSEGCIVADEWQNGVDDVLPCSRQVCRALKGTTVQSHADIWRPLDTAWGLARPTSVGYTYDHYTVVLLTVVQLIWYVGALFFQVSSVCVCVVCWCDVFSCVQFDRCRPSCMQSTPECQWFHRVRLQVCSFVLLVLTAADIVLNHVWRTVLSSSLAAVYSACYAMVTDNFSRRNYFRIISATLNMLENIYEVQ